MTLLRRFWYPIARSEELGTDVIERRLCGERLAVYRAHGKARVVSALCPHRGASLAKGKVIDGCIACPYHGWRFADDGRCTHIPSSSEPPPAGHSVPTFAVQEKYGFVWTALDEPHAELPPLDVLDRKDLRAFTVEDVLPLPLEWWLENTIDVAHVPLVHRQSYGGQDPLIDSYRVDKRADDLGFTAHVTTRHRYSLLARIIHGSVRHFEMKMRVEVWMPGQVIFDTDLGKGKRQIVVFLTTPEDDRSCRVWLVVLRNYMRLPFADAIGKWFTRTVIEEDARTGVESVERVAQPGRLSTPADAPALEFLRLLGKWRDRDGLSNVVSL